MNLSLLVRSSLAIGLVLSTLSLSDAVGQTLLDPYYPRPTSVSTPVLMRPVVAYRKYLAQGLSLTVAAQRSGAYAVRQLPVSGRLDLLFLGGEGEGGFDGQCAFIDAPATIWSGLVAPRPTVWVQQIICGPDQTIPPPPGRAWEFADTFEFKAPGTC